MPLPPRLSSGIAGLDDVLNGGFAAERLYLVEGPAGTGKTTLALQFVLEGVRLGEQVLYVTLTETAAELHDVAASHGWSLDGVTIRELVPEEGSLAGEERYTMFHASEVELAQTTELIVQDAERVRPTRAVFDSLSEIRLMAGSALEYRRQVLSFKQMFARRGCTLLMLDDRAGTDGDVQVRSIAHGVVMLESSHSGYGGERRRLRVAKQRATAFREGYHDYLIQHGGLAVFPRVVAAEHRKAVSPERVLSGIAEIDTLLGGGIECGTSTLLVGAPGTGKSSLAAQFVAAAAVRGERSAMFIMDESRNTLLSRAAGLGIDLARHVDSGMVRIQQVDPGELSPGEFAHQLRNAAESDGVGLVVIDSLNGLLNAMPDERFLTIQLHELLAFLGQLGVATILVGAHHGLIGSQMNTPVDASYLADSVVLLRYYEFRGEIRQAISVIKKRGGAHERSIREFRMGTGGISVGPPLREFRGILTGVPIHEGAGPPSTGTPPPP